MTTSALFISALFDHLGQAELERQLCSKQWLLAAPQISALPEPHLRTLDLFRSHVLIPVRGGGGGGGGGSDVLTLSGKRLRMLPDDELVTLVTPDAAASFVDERRVKVLHRETFFTSSGESYTCLTLSRPLQGAGREPYFDDDVTPVFVDRTCGEWLEVFRRQAPSQVVVPHGLAEFAAAIPRDPVAAAATTTGKARMPVVLALARAFASVCAAHLAAEVRAFSFAAADPSLNDMLTNALENVALSEAHGPVFAALCQAHASAERDVQLRLHKLRASVLVAGGSCDVLGLSTSFLERFLDSEALNAGALELQRLNDARCAHDKLKVLAKVLRGAREPLSADDEVPFTVLALLQASPACLLANCTYVSDFAPAHVGNQLQYKRAVFVSAVQLLQQAKAADGDDDDDDVDDDDVLNHVALLVNGRNALPPRAKRESASLLSQLACGMGAR